MTRPSMQAVVVHFPKLGTLGFGGPIGRREPAAGRGPPQARGARRRWPVVLAAVVLALLGGVGVWRVVGRTFAPLRSQCPDGEPSPCGPRGVRAPLPVLVVTPFENRSGDTADAYLSATLSEDVTASLASSHALRLLNPRGSRHGAEYLLTGSVRRASGGLRVTTRLERAGSGEIVWTTSLDGPTAQSTELAREIARRTLQRLGLHAAADREPGRPVDSAAYDVYLRGRYLAGRRTQADLGLAIALFAARPAAR